MSGFSPRGPGVITGPFPGCQQPKDGGSDGEISYHIPPTGIDANGCPTGGSLITVDEFNGMQQALNCILTQGNTIALPTQQSCENPCILWDSIKNYVDTSIAASVSEATDESCEDGVPIGVSLIFTKIDTDPIVQQFQQNVTVVDPVGFPSGTWTRYYIDSESGDEETYLTIAAYKSAC